jgi:hypothetical protein
MPDSPTTHRVPVVDDEPNLAEVVQALARCHARGAGLEQNASGGLCDEHRVLAFLRVKRLEP